MAAAKIHLRVFMVLPPRGIYGKDIGREQREAHVGLGAGNYDVGMTLQEGKGL